MKKFLKNEWGAVLVEAALSLPLIFLLFSGAINLGLIIAAKNTLTGVVSVGMLHAIGNSSDPVVVSNAMTDSTNITPLTVTAVQVCQCIGGSEPGCGHSCPDGKPAPKYIKISANSTVDLYAPDFVVTNPFPISVQAMIRVP